ncbi:hypothetical protein MTR67_040430 [Solanum verrucosum]|uniref:NB-ARC domain-containing protein n=1 Tax=Solanum verrucosum TaxID=315347 RepID=A0AAF0ZRN8_SOLVR|nr:hypothetical protein MTR67_040430 [Solanum verrucosum]
MVNTVTPSASTCNIHVMIEFILIILTDVPKDLIRHDKLFVLLERVRELTNEVFVLDRNLEENTNATSSTGLNLLENIELLKEDLKNIFLKARADSSQLRFPMSNAPLFMTLLLSNLNDLVNSNTSSVTLIKEEIKQVKEDLKIIRLFFGYVEQEFHRDLWTHVLDVAYEAEHVIMSILARDHGLLQLLFILHDTVEKIKLAKKEVQEKIPKSSDIIIANAPNNLIEINSSNTVGLGKTTLAFRVYNDKSIVDHFDVCAWCTVDQERNEKKLLQKIFNQVVGLKERFSENNIDDDVADKLRKKLCGQRNEKLLHFIGGSKALSSCSSSSSDLMPRGIIFSFNEYLCHFDENFVMFDPEMKNPYVKHLLSLKVDEHCVSSNSHLKHLRLLKSLDLQGITLPDSLLNEIGMLVHLKYLIIQTKAKSLPPSFSNLYSLEILVVNNLERSCMVLSPCFWSLVKLRDVRIKFCALFDLYINEPTVLDEDSRLENLTALYELYLLGSEDTEDIFKRLDVLNELEELRLSSSWDSFDEYTHGFPLSLKKMRLQGLALTSDTLSRIARLPNLEELILEDTIIEEGKEWNMEDVTFQNLKSLKLASMQFSEWQVDAEKCFPVLEKLDISRCYELMDIPDSFGDIVSLKFINVSYSPQLKESIFNIKEYVEEMTGENKLERDHINL